MTTVVYINGERLDLFDFENITVESRVQDVKDISKLFTDFSLSFNVPASRRNNRIFKQYYNFNINNGYDARVRQQASIDVDTLDFKFGKIRLNGAKVENGKPLSYNLTFFGEAAKIKELLGDDKLNQLDYLSNFDHAFNAANVELGMTAGLDISDGTQTIQNVITYPLISYVRQFLVNTDPSDSTSNDKLVNIKYDASRTDAVDFRNLKPCIKVDSILEGIRQKYNLNFLGTFFQASEWKNLYMNLNNSETTLSNGFVQYEAITGSISTGEFPEVISLKIRYQAIVTPDAGFEDVPYKIRFTKDGQTMYESSIFVTGDRTLYHEFTVNPPSGIAIGDIFTYTYDFTASCITNDDFEFNVNQRFSYRTQGIITSGSFINVTDNDYDPNITLEANILNIVPDIKVYDWLVSIQKMFNLVIVPVEDDLYVQDLQSWYQEGRIFDVTKFVSKEEHPVNRGKIYNELDFKFEESEQILSEEYANNNLVPYGNSENRLFDENNEPLDGGSLDISVIFETPIHERLNDVDTGQQTPIQYCPFIDKDLNGYTGAPFLLYCPRVPLGSYSIGLLGSGSVTEITADVRMPSHSYQIDTESFNLSFDAVINTYTFGVFEDTIFNRYWADYVGDIFSKKRRLIQRKAIFPSNLLHSIKLNDRLVIDDNRYIINRISSDLTRREDRLELINDIFDEPLPSDELNTSLFRNAIQNISALGGEFSNEYIGIDGQSLSLVDTGYGVSWVTLNTSRTSGKRTIVNYEVDANTGSFRTVGVKCNDKLNNPIFIIDQTSLVTNFTFDETAVTFDTITRRFDET